MRRVFLVLLLLAVMAQSLDRLMIVAAFQLNQETITELFCINKDKPEKKCKGCCYLAKEIKKANECENKVPCGLKQHDAPTWLVFEQLAHVISPLHSFGFEPGVYPETYFPLGFVSGVFQPPRA